eukprot:2693030-Amphidinium_carterae.1
MQYSFDLTKELRRRGVKKQRVDDRSFEVGVAAFGPWLMRREPPREWEDPGRVFCPSTCRASR